MPPLRECTDWPAGTAWSPIRGYVGLGARCRAGNQAGTRSVTGVQQKFAGIGAECPRNRQATARQPPTPVTARKLT